MAKHRCMNCGRSFATAGNFEAHPCVKEAAKMSLEDLMAAYEASRAKPSSK
jgi:hypothetical protein